MKKRTFTRLVTALALVTFPIKAFAAEGTGTSTATIVTPITITPVLDLAFGKFSANTGGTILIDPATAARSVNSGSVALVSQGNTTTAATFDIAGDGSAGFSITLPSSPIDITHTNGVDKMSVGSFTSSPASSSDLVAGAKTISVGATLTVGSGQVGGNYSGNFTVTVEYN